MMWSEFHSFAVALGISEEELRDMLDIDERAQQRLMTASVADLGELEFAISRLSCFEVCKLVIFAGDPRPKRRFAPLAEHLCGSGTNRTGERARRVLVVIMKKGEGDNLTEVCAQLVYADVSTCVTRKNRRSGATRLDPAIELDDFEQEAMLQLLLEDAPRQPRSLVVHSAADCVRRATYRRLTRRGSNERIPRFLPNRDDDDWAERVASQGPSPLELAISEEERALIQREVDALPPKARTAARNRLEGTPMTVREQANWQMTAKPMLRKRLGPLVED